MQVGDTLLTLRAKQRIDEQSAAANQPSPHNKQPEAHGAESMASILGL
jgi:hypothetical protein